MTWPFISIVVPTLNEENNLPRLFQSFKKLDYPKDNFEVIVVDGGSKDKTVAMAKEFGANILRNPKILRGAGCQIGVEKAQGEYVFFTDGDCAVPSNWLKGLVKNFKEKNIAGAGGPNITPFSDSSFSKAVGEVILLLTRPGSRYGFSSKKVVEIFHNSGCNAAYKKKAILKAGGFNKKLITCEDEELDFRIRKKGLKLLFIPDVIVGHYRRPTYKKIFIQAYRYAIGRSQAIKIHFKMARWFHFIPTFLLLSILSPLILLSSPVFPYAIYYVLIVSLGFLSISFFLSVKKGYKPFYSYFFIFLLWFIGYGIGFIRGLFIGSSKTENEYNEVKNVWENYWKNYKGVTKIGAWSQKQSINKALQILDEKKIKKSTRIIDMGCGEGKTLIAFREKGYRNIIGIDNTLESIKICEKKGLKEGRDVFLDEASGTKFKNNSLEIVFSEGILEHFKDPIPLISEMSRISKKYVLIIQPNHLNIYGLMIKILGHFLRGGVWEYTFTKKYFKKEFEKFGFFLKTEKYTPLGEFFILLFEKS